MALGPHPIEGVSAAAFLCFLFRFVSLNLSPFTALKKEPAQQLSTPSRPSLGSVEGEGEDSEAGGCVLHADSPSQRPGFARPSLPGFLQTAVPMGLWAIPRPWGSLTRTSKTLTLKCGL